ncbi:hypothetical protein VNO77_26692 [Canavalia gladiata]|uniref:Uncharacterized protein n=1 Tax=Canavalia gladiata TaxID=3824 RepID=A0AAN9KVK3_CANGL
MWKATGIGIHEEDIRVKREGWVVWGKLRHGYGGIDNVCIGKGRDITKRSMEIRWGEMKSWISMDREEDMSLFLVGTTPRMLVVGRMERYKMELFVLRIEVKGVEFDGEVGGVDFDEFGKMEEEVFETVVTK